MRKKMICTTACYLATAVGFGLILMGQGLTGTWRGVLTQQGVEQSFSYELQLQQMGAGLVGTACSQATDQSIRACFELTGLREGTTINLQEIRQTEPAEPKWCLKYLTLTLTESAKLSGTWKAPGCSPGELVLQKVGNTQKSVEEVPFTFSGRWIGHLNQSDRDYGFYYEVNLQTDRHGRSSIDSESNGGTAVHALQWFIDADQVVSIQESEVVEKTDEQWPWCIKQTQLQYRREGDRHILEGPWQGYIEGHTPQTGACAPGTIYLEKPVITQEVTAFVEDQHQDYQTKAQRSVKVDRVLEVKSENLKIKVWDNGTVDGDYITLFLNGEQLLHNYRVSKRKWMIPVKLVADHNFLILHADDIGDIPPNTVAISIDDGFKEEILILSSNLETSGGVLIKQFKRE